MGLKRKKTPDPDPDPEPDDSLQEARSLQLSALKKSNSMGFPHSVDTHVHPGSLLKAKILSDQMFAFIFLCQ